MEQGAYEWKTSPDQKKTEGFLSLQDEKKENKKNIEKVANLLLHSGVRVNNMYIKTGTKASGNSTNRFQVVMRLLSDYKYGKDKERWHASR